MKFLLAKNVKMIKCFQTYVLNYLSFPHNLSENSERNPVQSFICNHSLVKWSNGPDHIHPLIQRFWSNAIDSQTSRL